jgi:four helix bundle protein
MRQAAISIPANIAEGQARRGTRDYLRFLGISEGSLRELQTYTEVMLRLGYAEESAVQTLKSLTEQTARLLGKLVVALERRRERTV